MKDLQIPTKEDVLYAFAVEEIHDKLTLSGYLRDYPEYAPDLLDLAYELSLPEPEERELSAADSIAIDKAWERHVAAKKHE